MAMRLSRSYRQQRNSWATGQRIKADVQVEENESVNAAPRPLQPQPLTHCIQRKEPTGACTQSTKPTPGPRLAIRSPSFRMQTRSSANRCSSPVSRATSGQRAQSAQRSAYASNVPPPRSRLWRLALPPQLMILIRRLPISDCCWCAAAHAPAGGEGSAEMPAAATAKEC